MKNCPKCHDPVAPNAEVCSCGHWLRRNPAAGAPAEPRASRDTESAPAAPKRRREWLIVGGLLAVGLIVGLGLSSLVKREPGPMGPLSDGLKSEMRSTESLQAVAEFFNRDLPRKVSPDVRLDRVSAEPSGLVMSYTLLERTAANTSAEDVEKAFREKLRGTYCQENASRLIRDAGISVAHRYAGSDGSGITEILISPESCGTAHRK